MRRVEHNLRCPPQRPPLEIFVCFFVRLFVCIITLAIDLPVSSAWSMAYICIRDRSDICIRIALSVTFWCPPPISVYDVLA